MRSLQLSKIIMGLFSVIVALGIMSSNAMAQDAANIHKFDFYMAHKPDNADNVKLIQDFVNRVKERTNGQVVITPVAAQEFDDRPHFYAIRQLYNNELGMSQVSVKEFYPTGMSTEIDVLDMPLVFRDHDHATKVLDGEIGKDLMETVFIGSNGRIKGLAFTYSGGFRNFYSTQNISSLKDFAGMPMRNLGGRMSRDFVHHFDPDFVYSPAGTPEWIEDIKSGKVQIDESEVIRLAQYQRQFPEIFGEIKTVFETNHNLYLTLLAVNAKVFGALTPEQQAIVQEEANTLAEQERLLSIQQEQDGKAEFQKLGIKFITPSEEDKAMMQEAANIVHNKYRMTKGRWLRRIEDVK